MVFRVRVFDPARGLLRRLKVTAADDAEVRAWAVERSLRILSLRRVEGSTPGAAPTSVRAGASAFGAALDDGQTPRSPAGGTGGDPMFRWIEGGDPDETAVAVEALLDANDPIATDVEEIVLPGSARVSGAASSVARRVSGGGSWAGAVGDVVAFRRLVSPVLAPALWWAGVVAAVAAGIGMFVPEVGERLLAAASTTPVRIAVFATGVAALRVGAELAVVQCRLDRRLRRRRAPGRGR